MTRFLKPLACLAIALCLCGAERSHGAESRIRTKLYFCRRAEAPPVIDGTLDDPCWTTAYPMTDFGFLRFGDQKGPAPLTTVRAVYDDEHLYLAFDCAEPDMARFHETVNRTEPVYARDCIECYIDTQNDDKGYVCLMMNVRNESYAEARIDMGWLVVTDNSFNLWVRWKARGAARADGWSIEARINWQDLKVRPAAGAVMGFNPCRWRFASDVHQYLSWSTIGGYQKAPADYGHMVLGDRPNDLAAILRAIYPGREGSVFEVPTGDGLTILAGGRTTFATYREILTERVGALSDRLPASEAPAGKTGEQQARLREQVEELKRTIQAAETISEGESLGFLKAIDAAHAALTDMEWQHKRDALLTRFAEGID